MRGRLSNLVKVFFYNLKSRYLLPTACYFCGLPLTDDRYIRKPRVCLCAGCQARLSFVPPEQQGLCLPAHTGEHGRRRLYDPAAYPAALTFSYPDYFPCYSAMRYEEPINRAVAALKFGGDLAAVPPLGALLTGCIQQFILPREGAPDFLVPVPLHPRRLRERGYNQAAELALEAGRLCKLPVAVDGLQRVRATARQSTLQGVDQRAANLADAFRVNASSPRAFVGKSLILLDDVLTTGSTVRNAALSLVFGGAAKVVILTLAID